MNSVRIVGGAWRRRVLRFPDSENLRPTPDRVRETLFNWLGQDLSGFSCLDLFAGSGALGFEALSRGADRVVMVERAPKVLAAIRKNAETLLAAPRLQIIDSDAVKFAARSLPPDRRFDVLFFDPPYGEAWVERLASFLPRLAKDDARVYLEAEGALQTCGDWTTVRHGRAGRVHFHLMLRGGGDGVE
ncbi:MAG: 16S rRNA (guanine(966)-N(2))-methyltransferase RsmD [Candidatus Accumulibacter sp.]|jgi:16S rRNA (guanine966-N2)-methyltransferase|nr:16S rRNA (guanine(966)-N(2))-methyltransferase RsmD [Accumulibacter sp.]